MISFLLTVITSLLILILNLFQKPLRVLGMISSKNYLPLSFSGLVYSLESLGKLLSNDVDAEKA